MITSIRRHFYISGLFCPIIWFSDETVTIIATLKKETCIGINFGNHQLIKKIYKIL